MSIKRNILFLISLLLGTLTQAQVCADSVVIKRVQYVQNHNSSQFKLSLKTGGYLYYSHLSSPLYFPVLYKTDAEGMVINSKKILLPGDKKIFVSGATEGTDGSIFICGNIFNNINSMYDSSLYIAKLSPSLQTIWSKEIKVNSPGSYNYNFSEQKLFLDKDDNIFFSFRVSASMIDFQHVLVSFNTVGLSLWSKGIEQDVSNNGQQFTFTEIHAVYDKVFHISSNFIDSLVNPVTGTYIFRSGFTCFAYNKNTGSYIDSRQIFIPSVTQFCENSGLGSGIDDNFRGNLQWNEYTNRFDYFFHEFDYKPTGAPCYPSSPFDAFSINRNIINISFDTALNTFEPKRITGQIYYAGQSDVLLFPQNKLMATISHDSILTPFFRNFYLTVADNNNQILFSKAIDTSITKYYYVSSLNFANNDSTVAVSFIGNPFFGRTDVIELNIPLYSEAPAYRCFTKDTVPVTFSNNVQLENRSFVPAGLHNNVAVVNDLTLLSEYLPITPQVNEICKVVSVCSSLVLSGKHIFCTDKPQTYVARKNEECLKKIVWNTATIPATILGQTDSSITLQFSGTWKGKLTASLYGCTINSELNIEVYKKQKPLTLGNDTLWCSTNNLKLNAGSGFKFYRWQDGSTDSNYTVTGPGKYFVTAADYCGNTYSDTIEVKPSADLLNAGNDKTICKFETATLRVSDGFLNYNWWPPQTLNTNNTPVVAAKPEVTTTYFIKAEKFAGCFAYDTITVKVENCPQHIYIPTAFTPNNDGKNDVFKPVITAPLQDYKILIYNRWGQQVFISTNVYKGWDGKFNGTEQPPGIYIWYCHYRFGGQEAVQKQGNIVLIK